jgi:hypothetical protein
VTSVPRTAPTRPRTVWVVAFAVITKTVTRRQAKVHSVLDSPLRAQLVASRCLTRARCTHERASLYGCSSASPIVASMLLTVPSAGGANSGTSSPCSS